MKQKVSNYDHTLDIKVVIYLCWMNQLANTIARWKCSIKTVKINIKTNLEHVARNCCLISQLCISLSGYIGLLCQDDEDVTLSNVWLKIKDVQCSNLAVYINV